MWKLCLKPLNLYVEPVDLHLKRGTFVWSLGMCFFRVEPLCGTWANLNLYAEPLWNLETFKCGTSMWNLGNLNLYVEPLSNLETFKCGASMWNLGNLNLYVEPLSNLETFKCGASMWNLRWKLCGTWNPLSVEPWGTWTFMWTWNLLRVKPLCRTLGNLVPGFRPLPKPPRGFIGRTPSFSSCWGKNTLTTYIITYSPAQRGGGSFKR